jgi:hypothetical protein
MEVIYESYVTIIGVFSMVASIDYRVIKSK